MATQPIAVVDGASAFRIASRNKFSTWPPLKGRLDRISPICYPEMTPRFRLTAGASIFTVGSCFARNIEEHLARLGFVVPTLSFDPLGPVNGRHNNYLNRYTCKCILQELQWGLGLDIFPWDHAFVQIPSGQVIDLYAFTQTNPATLEIIRSRRQNAQTIFAGLSDCEAIVITLGLTEAWFDLNTRRYVNGIPYLLRSGIDRFEFHLLSYSQILESLEAIIKIARSAQPEIKILFSISPVPLNRTFTENDILVANCYSKSVQRAAVTEVYSRYPFVDYIPTYEAITWTEYSRAFEADNTHVRDDIVALNVERVLSEYVE